uniref:Uncharacterized protein n=1 Tax=Heterorhabditis bacteriophora TaxID=37862 RepID=A0A1I7WEV8_HETBA
MIIKNNRSLKVSKREKSSYMKFILPRGCIFLILILHLDKNK